jgi:hypothetical protein
MATPLYVSGVIMEAMIPMIRINPTNSFTDVGNFEVIIKLEDG